MSSFKHLILETPLWQGAMSSSLLKNVECEKGTPPVRPPIPYIPPTNLHKKQETKQIKVVLLDGSKFQMPTYGTGNNEETLLTSSPSSDSWNRREPPPRSRKPLRHWWWYIRK
jgi:hypothetical protein